MKHPTPVNLPTIFAVVLALAALATIVLQISLSDNSPTQLETALFSILQFIFSIAFSWVIAKASSHQEFQESQKRFAIAAYRRIKEIDTAVERVIARVRRQMLTAEGFASRELDVVNEIATGIRESIKSSTADWGDIIGEEIAAVEEIEALRQQQSRLLKETSPPGTNTSTTAPSPKLVERLENTQQQLDALLHSLPHSLRIAAESVSRTREEIVEDYLDEVLSTRGYIELVGYHDGDFEVTVEELTPGSILHVKLGDTSNRTTCLIAETNDRRTVGVLTNFADELDYDEFAIGLLNYLGHSEFSIELVDVEVTNRPEKHFRTKLLTPRRLVPVFDRSEPEQR